jgi:hypothetical protein
MSECCDKDTPCETECSNETECCQQPCESGESCPVECAAEMWHDSFEQAMHEAQVEILKEKILAAHRPMLEQAADALLESKMACWQSMIAKVHAAKAKQEFKEKLFHLWTQK